MTDPGRRIRTWLEWRLSKPSRMIWRGMYDRELTRWKAEKP